MKIADLFVQLGVKTDTKELTAFNQVLKETVGNLDKLKKEIGDGLTKKVREDGNEKKQGIFVFLKNLPKLIKSSPIIASLIYIARAISQVTLRLAKLVLNLTQVSYETLKLARNFGVSTSAMQRFGYEAVASGVKLNDFQSAVARLKQNSADILLGRGDISPYALLGINPHEDPEKVLMHLQQRLKELPESIGTAFASDLGLSPDMINFVRKADFSKVANRPQLSRAELKNLDDLRGTLLETMNLLSLVGQKILTTLSPLINTIFSPINKFLESWVVNLKELRSIILQVMGIAIGVSGIFNPALAGVLSIMTAIGLIVEDLVVHKGEGLKLWAENIGIMAKRFFDSVLEFIDTIIQKIKSIPSTIGGGIGKFFDFIDSYLRKLSPDYTPDLRSIDSHSFKNTKVNVDLSLSGAVQLKDAQGRNVGSIDGSNIDLTNMGVNDSNVAISGVKP